jgi:hypothetical protein
MESATLEGAMGQIGRTKVTLRLLGDSLDPESVTSLLGQQPTKSWRAGDPRPGGPAKSGSWHLQSELPGDLETQIKGLLASLSPDIAIWKVVTKQHHADLFCGLFLTEENQGLVLTPDTMGAIAQRGLELSLDVYVVPDVRDPVPK